MISRVTASRWSQGLLITQFFWGMLIGLLVFEVTKERTQGSYGVVALAILVSVLPLEGLRYLLNSGFVRTAEIWARTILTDHLVQKESAMEMSVLQRRTLDLLETHHEARLAERGALLSTVDVTRSVDRNFERMTERLDQHYRVTQDRIEQLRSHLIGLLEQHHHATLDRIGEMHGHVGGLLHRLQASLDRSEEEIFAKISDLEHRHADIPIGRSDKLSIVEIIIPDIDERTRNLDAAWLAKQKRSGHPQ